MTIIKAKTVKKNRNKTLINKEKTPFAHSLISRAIKLGLVASGLVGGMTNALADLPVEFASDSRFNIDSIVTNANTMTVTQNQDLAWIKWDSYNIGEGNTVAYNYTEGGNAFHALNFVLGSQISEIQGSITSEGNVYIFNSNGIVFSNSAIVNVAGLLASTQTPSLDTIDGIATQFANGESITLDSVLSGLEGSGAIEVNDQASLTSTLNDITLMGETISSNTSDGSGVTLQSQGSINLYANNRSTVTIDRMNDVFSVEVTEKLNSDPGESLIDMQDSQMIAQVGVNISALSAQTLTMNAVNTTGIVQADSVSIDADGTVVLGDITTAGELAVRVSDGDVTDEGTIDAASASFTMLDTTEANITLDSENNNIVAFSASGDNLNDVTLVDTFGMVLNGVQANTLTLFTTGDVAQSDVLIVNDVFINASQGDARFNIFLDQVFDDGTLFNQIDQFGAIGHNVFLLEDGGIELTGISATSDFALSTDGDIFQTGSVSVLDETFIFAINDNGEAFNIVLEDGNNEFGTFSGLANSMSLVDGNGLTLGDIEVVNQFTATALSGDITATGTLLAPRATFNALDNTEANIVLASLDNDIGTFAAVGDNINEIFINDNAGIVLDGLSANLFTLTTTGAVTQTDVLSIGDALIQAVNGNTTYNIELDLVTDNGETFNQIGAFGAVGNSVILVESGGILLTGITATQDLLISTDGLITQNQGQNAALTVGGNSLIAALSDRGVGFDVVLDNADNDFGVFSGIGNNISITDGFGLELGNIEVANAFFATSMTGDITDLGTILAPQATFTALGNNDTSGNIRIDTMNNNIGLFSASGNTVDVFAANGLVLGDINANTALNAVVMSGDVTDEGTIDAASASFTMLDATEANITLDSENNNIVAFSASGDNLNDVTLVDTFGMVLNGVQANTLTLFTTGDVAQSDVLIVNDVFINASQGDARFNIFLDQVFDDGTLFNQIDQFGAIGHNVFLLEDGGIELTGISATSDFALSTDGDIFQTGSVSVLDETFIFAINDNGEAFNIVLEDGNNEFGTFSGLANSMSLVDGNGLTLGDIEVVNQFTATALSGDITATGTLLAPRATFNALDNTEANIELASLDNDIGTFAAVGDNINEIFINDNAGIVLDGLSANLFTLNTTGAVTQTDVLNIGDALIQAVNGNTTYNIELDLVTDNGETFNQIGAFGALGNSVVLVESGGILLTGITATQDLLISTDGLITQNQGQNAALTVGGNSLIAALSDRGVGFDVVLDNADNDFGVFSGIGNNISITDGFGLELGNVEVANAFFATSMTGDITDLGTILAPQATFTARGNNDTSGNVRIDTMDNNIGVFSASGNTVDVFAANGLVLGDINANTAFNAVVMSGDVTDEGTIDAASASFTMLDTTEANITLDSEVNQISEFTAVGENINAVEVANSTDLALGNIEATSLMMTTSGNISQQAQSQILVDSVSLTFTEDASLTLANEGNQANSVSIDADQDLTIESLAIAAMNSDMADIIIETQGNLSISDIATMGANVDITSHGHVLSASTESDSGFISANNVVVRAAETVNLNSIQSANNVELMAFGTSSTINQNGVPVTIAVSNPIQAGGQVGYAVHPNAGALVSATSGAAEAYFVTSGFSQNASLGLDGTPSSSVTAAPGGTLLERNDAIEGFVTGLRSINLPAQNPVKPDELDINIGQSEVPVRIPEELQAGE